ncbi:hypothetical protein GGR52DRAFT_570383 [Hypoxylon sp. FL1284]|nr:hypothetical protein GGR52DRAFT_570383 [Hypoxylon sp. FL1284]
MANNDNNNPGMPLAASSNASMKMKMATAPVPSDKTTNIATDSTATQKAANETNPQSQPGDLTHHQAMTSDKSKKHGKTENSRKLELSVQTIQLAESLRTERDQRTALEADLSSAMEKLSSLTIRNEYFEDQHKKDAESLTQQDVRLQSERDLRANLEACLQDAMNERDNLAAEFGNLKELYSEDFEKGKEQAEKIHRLDDELKDIRSQLEQLSANQKALQEEYDDAKSTVVSLRQSLKSREDEIQQLTASGSVEAKDPGGRFPQTIVIGVDTSGSTYSLVDNIKQAYTNVLHAISQFNGDAKVGVIIHSSSVWNVTLPPAAISHATRRFLENGFNRMGGEERYAYCLEQAVNMFSSEELDDSKKLLLLIGDGDAVGPRPTRDTYIRLKGNGALAHSIVISHDGKFSRPMYGIEYSMWDISRATGGRVEGKNTYLSALDEILRHEREQHFLSSSSL